MALPISIIKRGAYNTAHTLINGIWREIDNPQNIPGWESISATNEADFGKIYRGTSGGSIGDYNAALKHYFSGQEFSNYGSRKAAGEQEGDFAKWKSLIESGQAGGDYLAWLGNGKQSAQSAPQSTQPIPQPAPQTQPQPLPPEPITPQKDLTYSGDGQETPEDIARSKSGEYYKIGNDVFSSAAN